MNHNNYRCICVTSFIRKLYGRVMKIRTETKVEISEQQNDFRSGRSCIYNVFSFIQLAEKSIAYSKELYLKFTDLKKAYDSVRVQKVCKVKSGQGVSVVYINGLKE